MQCNPWNRIQYREFYEKHYSDIIQLFSTAPPMSPEEFRSTIYNLTVYNPELLYDAEPWFELKKIGDIEYYHMTNFGKEVIENYNNNLFDSQMKINFISCCFIKKSKFLNNKDFNDNIINDLLNQKINENNIQIKFLQENKKYNQKKK